MKSFAFAMFNLAMVLALWGGIGFSVIGLDDLASDPKATPTCDGKIMSPGDFCLVTGASSYTYSSKLVDQRAAKDRAYQTIGIGVVLLVSAVLWFITKGALKRRGVEL
ncbi:hypothetical protein [Nocardia noduli]|uniref:hypothetical protein n=1 Tax=Nocardia noduli TaxID=2815722 RepID=UPI001C231A3E|nr:hypothetical protein [Nocardia noduli]